MSPTSIISRTKSYILNSGFFRDILGVFSSNVLGLFLSFGSGVIVARYLGVEGKGLLTTLLVYPQLIITLSQMGVRQATVYEIGRGKYDFQELVGNVVSLFLFSGLFGTTLSIIILSFFSSYDYTFLVIILASATIPLALINSYTGAVFLGKQKIGLSTIVSWAPKLIYLILLVIFLVWLGLGITAALAATIIAGLPVAYYAIKKVVAEVLIKPLFSKELLRSMLSLGFVYALAIFLNSLNYRIDLIFLEQMSTPDEVGLYSVGVSFAELVLQVPAAVGIVIFSRSSNSKDPKIFSTKTVRLLKYGLFAAVFAGSLLCLIAPYVVPWLYTEAFRESVPMLQLLMPGIIALVAYKIIGFDMAGKGKPWASVVASLPGVLVNILLNLVLIPKLGGKGAAIASSISYCIMGLAHWFIFKRILSRY